MRFILRIEENWIIVCGNEEVRQYILSQLPEDWENLAKAADEESSSSKKEEIQSEPKKQCSHKENRYTQIPLILNFF